MKVLRSVQDDILKITLSGELDHNAARSVMKAIDEIIDEYLPRQCALDMSGVGFMDSSGIAVIVRANKQIASIGGKMWVENCGGQALRVLDAAGLGRVVKICVN